MKKITIFFTLVVLFGISAKSQTGTSITLEGVYQGENLYVLNPFASTGVGFCIYEVTVNNEITTDEINSSSFEIDLVPFNLKQGDPIKVVIKHKEGCTPRVLNEDVLKPKSTFTVTAISVDKTGLLKWTTIDENGKLPFEVQQFRWNKWVTVGEIQGIGTPAQNNYTFNLMGKESFFKPHSGVNKYRIKQTDFRKKPRYSLETTYRPITITAVSITALTVKDNVTFSEATSYEIYDSFGKLINRGHGSTVDVKALPKGDYYLNYDNTAGAKFKKQ